MYNNTPHLKNYWILLDLIMDHGHPEHFFVNSLGEEDKPIYFIANSIIIYRNEIN